MNEFSTYRLGQGATETPDNLPPTYNDAGAPPPAQQYPSIEQGLTVATGGSQPEHGVPSPPRPSNSATLSQGLSWPPGFAGAVAHYIYDSAPRPVPEVAIVGALGLLSGICGKAWVTHTKTGLNQYLILVARSAIGKEAMHSGIAMLIKSATKDSQLHLAKCFVDFNDFASGQALQKASAANRSFVNVTGEFGQRLRQIALSTNKPDSPMQNLRRVMTNLYSKSGPQAVAGGIAYSDKEKNLASVEGFAYSLIGETTPGTFYELLTPDMMADGFMSRFTVVEYEGERPPENDWADYFSAPWPELLQHLQHLLLQALTLLNREQTQTVPCVPDAHALLKAFSLECDSRIQEAGDDESRRQMWNRAHLKALKIASLLAVADSCLTPLITTVQAQWAIDFIKRDIAVFTRRLQSGDIGTGDDAREAKLLSIAHEYLAANTLPCSAKDFETLKQNHIIPRKYLQQRTSKVAAFSSHRNGSTKALDEAVRSLIDSGLFMEVAKTTLVESFSFHGKAYRVLSLGKPSAQTPADWLDKVLEKMTTIKSTNTSDGVSAAHTAQSSTDTNC